jgi:hypothetical protein
MSSRKTIYLGDDAEMVIGTRPRNLSGRINTILLRYDRIIDDVMPTLSEAEWCALCDANNGTVLDDHPQTVCYLWANVADFDGLGEKWGVDQAALVDKLRILPYAALCALAEVIADFWGNDKVGKADNRTLLSESGAKVAD